MFMKKFILQIDKELKRKERKLHYETNGNQIMLSNHHHHHHIINIQNEWRNERKISRMRNVISHK